MAASPQPPSLHLPKTIHDLAAVRIGNQVNLHWSTPSETTDKLRIKGLVQLRVCRKLDAAPCQTIATITGAPGKPADYEDKLPASLVTGPLYAMAYEIFAVNKHRRSAGPSNVAEVLAGEAPSPIQNLLATTVERGVMLRWQSIASLPPDTSIQLQRTLLTPANSSGNASVSEPTRQTLQVTREADNTDPGRALDNNIVFNRRYQYVAMRVTRVKVGKEWLEVDSASSPSAAVFTRDVFPPASPSGLAAVPVSAAINGGKSEVDLSWTANTESDMAQYLIFRRDISAETPSNQSVAEQIGPENPKTPVVVPAFRDRHVQPGHTYAYCVIAMDNAGNKSQRSKEVAITVPRL